jgi:hypothetical protein
MNTMKLKYSWFLIDDDGYCRLLLALLMNATKQKMNVTVSEMDSRV